MRLAKGLAPAPISPAFSHSPVSIPTQNVSQDGLNLVLEFGSTNASENRLWFRTFAIFSFLFIYLFTHLNAISYIKLNEYKYLK